MNPERWSRITALFEAARELSGPARAELLAGVDPDERAEVESLLAHAMDDSMDDIRDAVVAAARAVLPDVARPAPPLPSGARLGRYVVLDRVGAGGMGVVYAAWDPELDRKVAIKLLHRDIGGDDVESPLSREAKAMAQLAHPNVLAIHDVGTFDGQVFVTTEFVDGVTLRRWLKTPRSSREILGVLIAAGQGLAAAHAAGIIHRDIKPDNIMIGRDGRVRVMDFGLARAGRAPTPTDVVATSQTSVAGTPAYMAPEQWEGRALDARTDVFAFCVTAWECLHGEPPFGGDTVTATADAITVGRLKDPRPRRLPRRLLHILLRGLQTDPAARYPDMGALLAELQRDPRARLVRAARWVLTFAAVLALAYVGHLLTRPGRVSVRLTRAGVPLAAADVHVGAHALALDGDGARGDVPAGTYRLTARAPDHLPREAVVDVERGQEVHLDLEMQHEQGRLDLEVDPPGATIYVDGVDHGGRLRGLLVDTGERRLRVRHPGHYDVERTWTVAAERTRAGYVALPRGVAWSLHESGIQRPIVALGDLDGDGRAELLYRNNATLSVVSPWRDRTLWRTADAARWIEHWTGDLDGDALVDVVLLEVPHSGAAQASAWAGASLGDPHARPLWSRSGEARDDPQKLDGTHVVADVDGDGAVDLITAALDPNHLTACSGRTGQILWRAPHDASIHTVLVDAAAARLLVVTDVDRHALVLRTGAPLWSKPATRPRSGRALALPGAGAVALVVATYDSERHVLDVDAHDVTDGAVRWTHSHDWAAGPPPQIFVGRDAAVARVVLSAPQPLGLDLQTGVERWRLARSGRVAALDRGPDGAPALVAVATDRGLAAHRLDDGAPLFDVDLGDAAIAEPRRFDWDADGELELAIASRDGTISMVALDGAREGSLYLPDTAPIELVALGDLDRDGFDDLSITGSGGPTLVLGPKVAWSRRAQDALRAAPVVADLDADGRPELVVAGIIDGARGLHCFDAATGDACWPAEHMPGADIIRAPALIPRDDGGFDLLTLGGPVLYRHDGRTGAQRSHAPLVLGYATPAVVDLDADGALEALLTPWGAAELLAVDPARLTARWRLSLPTGAWNAPLVARERGATLLVLHLLDGTLWAVDAATRTPRWTRPLGQLPYAAPTVADLDGDGALELIASEVGDPGDLVCLRLSDGTELWRRPGLAGRSSPVVAHDLDGDGALELLHTTNGSGVVALDRRGATRWQFAPYPARERQPLSDGGGLLTDLDGDGAPELVTALRDEVAYVLDARTGALRWQFHAGGRIEAAPVAVDSDGDGRKELVIAGHDRVLQVLRTPARRGHSPQ